MNITFLNNDECIFPKIIRIELRILWSIFQQCIAINFDFQQNTSEKCLFPFFSTIIYLQNHIWRAYFYLHEQPTNIARRLKKSFQTTNLYELVLGGVHGSQLITYIANGVWGKLKISQVTIDVYSKTFFTFHDQFI